MQQPSPTTEAFIHRYTHDARAVYLTPQEIAWLMRMLSSVARAAKSWNSTIDIAATITAALLQATKEE